MCLLLLFLFLLLLLLLLLLGGGGEEEGDASLKAIMPPIATDVTAAARGPSVCVCHTRAPC